MKHGMSEHFQSDNVTRMPVSRIERRRLRRMFAAPSRPRGGGLTGTTIGVVLVAAVCAGLAIGLEPGERQAVPLPAPDKPIQWDEVQKVPRGEVSPVDEAWANGGGSTIPEQDQRSGSATIPSFGYCSRGGGTNCVVDGDTLHYAGSKIRIANIDAPETHPSRCPEEERLGTAATIRLRDLLNSGELSLSRIDRNEDKYGRKLRHVAVGGADVGETLVGEGLARPYAGGRQPWC